VESDEEVCLCFHVTRGKLLSYLRVERPRRASQLSACSGAGTGCGWCRPFLRQMFAQARGGQTSEDAALPEPDTYARQRAEYLRQGPVAPPSEDRHAS
jgi:bacterioferritin-associated ferredoxin